MQYKVMHTALGNMPLRGCGWREYKKEEFA